MNRNEKEKMGFPLQDLHVGCKKVTKEGIRSEKEKLLLG